MKRGREGKKKKIEKEVIRKERRQKSIEREKSFSVGLQIGTNSVHYVRGSLHNCAVRCTHHIPMVTKVEGKLRPHSCPVISILYKKVLLSQFHTRACCREL